MIDRLKEELAALKEKRNKLITFVTANPSYIKLPIAQRRLLNKQLDVMTSYCGILRERLNLLENSNV